MVKLEGASGSVVLINPSTVTLIAELPAEVATGQSIVHTAGVCSATVKGTPDEAYAKLFPGASGIVDLKAAEEALVRMAESPSILAAHAVALARKALGR